jgi:hypothetical protein
LRDVLRKNYGECPLSVMYASGVICITVEDGGDVKECLMLSHTSIQGVIMWQRKSTRNHGRLREVVDVDAIVFSAVLCCVDR